MVIMQNLFLRFEIAIVRTFCHISGEYLVKKVGYCTRVLLRRNTRNYTSTLFRLIITLKRNGLILQCELKYY